MLIDRLIEALNGTETLPHLEAPQEDDDDARPHSPFVLDEAPNFDEALGDALAENQLLVTGLGGCPSRLPPVVHPAHLPRREPPGLRVLDYDAHLLALHKPANFPVLPSIDHAGSVLHTLCENCSDPIAQPPLPVYRLGAGTSGVLLCASSREAADGLNRLLTEGKLVFMFRALVKGVVEANLDIDVPIGPSEETNGWPGTVLVAMPRALSKRASGGIKRDFVKLGARNANTLCHVKRRDVEKNQTLVDILIPGGWPHQIRPHLAFAGAFR